ncbi:uncharacterized protein LOC113503414 [Trichoplusia ni]|uniref:Uncharacterized protein LOC113503414 n=1 Tax=Trichoplusia ni TaxID=7111 RepID=A0A7E5WLD8_TRINI|nr:uncharacterized protein LOC113503414 [Trichoplusia ni]
MLIRTVGGESWTGCRGRAGVGRAVLSRAGCSSRGSGGPAPCGSAAARPSGGRALVRSRLCAPLALHCKSRSVDDATKEDPCLTGRPHVILASMLFICSVFV